MHQLAHYASDDDEEEYVVIIDLDDTEIAGAAFARQGFKLREIVDVDADLSSFPVGSELRRV